MPNHVLSRSHSSQCQVSTVSFTGDAQIQDCQHFCRHWTSGGTKIDVCSKENPTDPPQNCQPLPDTSGQSDQVTIPQGQNQRIVIRAHGFDKPESAAIVDDIQVQCDPCGKHAIFVIATLLTQL